MEQLQLEREREQEAALREQMEQQYSDPENKMEQVYVKPPVSSRKLPLPGPSIPAQEPEDYYYGDPVPDPADEGKPHREGE